MFLLGCGAEHVIGSLGFRVETHPTGVASGSTLAVTVADVDGDGRGDVVFVDGSAAQLCWLLSRTDGTLAAVSCQPNAQVAGARFVAALGSPLTVGDDLVVARSTPTPTVMILARGGAGSFALADSATLDGGAAALHVARVDSDEWADVLVAEQTKPAVSIWPLDAGRKLARGVRYTFMDTAPPRALLFADLDDDQRKDLAVLSENQLSIDGPRGALAVTQCPLGPGGVRFGAPTAIAAFPADRYGDTEVLLADSVRGGLVRVRRLTDGVFDCGDGSLWQPAGRAVALLNADFDGDGSVDVLAIFEAGEALFFSRGAAWAGRAAPRYRLPGPVQAAAYGDLDGDDRPEAVAALSSGEVVVLRNLFLPVAAN